MNNIDFSKVIDSDIEALDPIFQQLGKIIEKYESAKFIDMPKKIERIELAYKMILHMTDGTDAIVTKELHKPIKGYGYIKIEGKNMSFKHPEWLSVIGRFASSLEITACLDGKIDIMFGWNKIAVIEKE